MVMKKALNSVIARTKFPPVKYCCEDFPSIDYEQVLFLMAIQEPQVTEIFKEEFRQNKEVSS